MYMREETKLVRIVHVGYQLVPQINCLILPAIFSILSRGGPLRLFLSFESGEMKPFSSNSMLNVKIKYWKEKRRRKS